MKFETKTTQYSKMKRTKSPNISGVNKQTKIVAYTHEFKMN